MRVKYLVFVNIEKDKKWNTFYNVGSCHMQENQEIEKRNHQIDFQEFIADEDVLLK